MKKCKNCKHFIGLRDFGLCCELDYGLWYEDNVCEKWELKKNDKLPVSDNKNLNVKHPGPPYRI